MTCKKVLFHRKSILLFSKIKGIIINCNMNMNFYFNIFSIFFWSRYYNIYISIFLSIPLSIKGSSRNMITLTIDWFYDISIYDACIKFQNSCISNFMSNYCQKQFNLSFIVNLVSWFFLFRDVFYFIMNHYI